MVRVIDSLFDGYADIKRDSILRDPSEYDADAELSVELDVPNVLEMCLAPQGEQGFSPRVSLNREDSRTIISVMNKDSVERSYVQDGATFIPNVSDEGILTWSNDLGVENPSPANIKGPKGEFIISGTVNHESLLPDISTVENGTMYLVGTEIPRNVYVADKISEQWINQGKLEGPQGEPGEFNFATFGIENGYLVANKTENLELIDFRLNDKGELEVIV